ncbi:hypothetical protein FRACYDRAFT_240057 [Fragilariopsis cylindrus CCMP1102]|uniref:Rab3-GAP regulatory subunit N-terminal domain-containing protein n=1 Tax=Fragilariopsis cylindrus CCMP1102 TaxID=635003 RepID=A0A1E7FB49_9STRA|nr:hypothetical protein FRACYDRAFT_240057 [Fragilariopsis cylindrus CCMP1102]|eukprot:OEU15371.1 hypothetical protein FRACYDRAFT_240057 [Fragilariopsis cylindrus CCMP1102]
MVTSSEQQESGEKSSGKYIEAAALLSHVQILESKLPKGENDTFGHRKAPQLSLCRILDPDTTTSRGSSRRNLPILAMMAYTERCISAQLLRESVGFSGVGAPVEVLVVEDEDAITSAIMIPLERLDLSIDDTLVVADQQQSDESQTNDDDHYNQEQHQQQQRPKSLMSGGVIPISPNPRLAIIVGTKSNRVISIEFTVQPKSMQLLRRSFYVGEQAYPYFEPFPRDRLSTNQEDLPQTTADRSRWTRRNKGDNKKNKEVIVPFIPTGGVTSVKEDAAGNNDDSSGGKDMMATPVSCAGDDTYVWIGYGDGTGIRLHHAGLFPSVVQKYTDIFVNKKDNDNDNENGNILIDGTSNSKLPSLEDVLGQPLIRWHAHLSLLSSVISPSDTITDSNSAATNSMVVIPIPKYHPTPLAAATNCVTPFPTSWNDAYQVGMMGRGIDTGTNDDTYDDDDMNKKDKDDSNNNANDINGDWSKDYEAIVYCKNNFDHSFPTLVFYTSEDQYPGRFQGDLQELLYGSPSSEEKKNENSTVSSDPISSIVGGIFGFFGGGGNGEEEEEEEKSGGKDKDNNIKACGEDITKKDEDDWDSVLPFPAINRAPIDLYAGVEIHDSPRQITSCTIEPDGNLAALTDTLGRVSLVDLTTKQIIRMWKGFRETSCHWIQVPRLGTTLKPMLYLLIHSRQRCVVEVWQMTHGTRVKSIQVGREAQVINCRQKSPAGYFNTCYIAYSSVPFSNMNQVERIVIPLDDDDQEKILSLDTAEKIESSIQSQESTARMNRLQQFLGQTNVECQSVDVYKAMEDIDSLDDLSKCLDTVAMSSSLEEKMEVDGSSFQRLILSLCQQKLDEAISGGGEESLTNPHVELLAFKISYYTQICSGYEILHRYEMGNDEAGNNLEVKQPDSWGLEAAGWTSTYLKITKEIIDRNILPPPTKPMMFYEFASCLVAPKKWRMAEFDEDNGGYALYLSDSTRTRKDIVARIFRPLVSDIFSFNVVNQIFESIGIKNNYEYKLRCFGEWFVGLPIKKATKNAVFAQFSPSIRWLKETVASQIDTFLDDEEIAPMDSLYNFCRASEDLIRAFWLGALCRQAIYEVATDKEGETYGKIDSTQIIDRWDVLLRQLRVCLLVSLRLFGNPLGACPMSVKNVDKNGNFSVYEWLARDELTMSHKQPEIASLEIACQISSRAFDPSKPEGDGKTRWKTVQRSCLTAALGESERAEYLVDFDDDERLGALHLYLRLHNKPELLAPHRALLLVSKWGRKPKRIDILEDAIIAMQAIDLDKQKSVAYSVILEVWQSRIRPIFRAMLLGFADVQEISSEVIAPLLNDAGWVNAFSKLASKILDLLVEIIFEEGENVSEWSSQVADDDTTWPPVRDCFILQRLVARNKALDRSALETHQTLVYALRINNDVQKLTECIPSFYHLFVHGALFTEVLYTEEIEEKQHEFMQDSIVAFAKAYHGPNMDILNMGDIGTLADLWDFDMVNVNTLFLLSMYEFGKDAAVDELLTKSSSLISVQHFVDEGLDIMCRRLNNLLNVNPSDDIRSIMGTLDADICEWVKDKAEDSEPLLNAKFDVKIGSTHLFGLRLLSLAATADVQKDQRIQIHSLIVLSGTIVKVLESAARENETTVEASRPQTSKEGSSSVSDVSTEEVGI